MMADGAGRQEDALRHFTEAARLKPDDKQVVLLKASALNNLKRHSEAIQELNRLLLLDPKHAPALWSRGTILRATGKLDEAMADIEQAIRYHDMPVYHLEKANILIVSERYAEACTVLEHVTQMGTKNREFLPYSVMAMRTKAQILRANGQTDAADKLEQMAAELHRLTSGAAPKKGGCGGGAAAAVLFFVIGALMR